MLTIPWHPAIVHIPLGLTLVLPLIALIIYFLIEKGRIDSSAWIVVVILQAFIVTGAFIALKTGEIEEHRVERIVKKSFVHEHEEKAEWFAWISGAALALNIAGYFLKRSERVAYKQRRVIDGVVFAGILLSLAVAFTVGKSGGELVYKHGAAGAVESADDHAILQDLQNSPVDKD